MCIASSPAIRAGKGARTDRASGSFNRMVFVLSSCLRERHEREEEEKDQYSCEGIIDQCCSREQIGESERDHDGHDNGEW